MENLRNITSLEILNLDDTNVTDKGMRNLQDYLN
jgi:hypothetical protein